VQQCAKIRQQGTLKNILYRYKKAKNFCTKIEILSIWEL
jgi:hypothetical protein